MTPTRMKKNLKKQAKKKFGTTKSKQAKRYIWGTIKKRNKND